jgi:hypothetical protein
MNTWWLKANKEVEISNGQAKIRSVLNVILLTTIFLIISFVNFKSRDAGAPAPEMLEHGCRNCHGFYEAAGNGIQVWKDSAPERKKRRNFFERHSCRGNLNQSVVKKNHISFRFTLNFCTH